MPKKLVDLEISEISSVNAPANKRTFLIVKRKDDEMDSIQEQDGMEIRAMTGEQAKQQILKTFGSYEQYRKSVMAEPVEKTLGSQREYVEACEGVAKAAGKSLGEYFAENPASYSVYRQMSYARRRKA